MAAVVAEEPASMVMAGMFNSSIPKKGARYTPEDGFFLMDNPKKYYTPQYQTILRAKVTKIAAPILIVQGSPDRTELPINRFNAEVLVPELRAALDAFRDIDAFCRRYLRIQPKQVDSRLVTQAPVPTEWPRAAQNR